MSTRVNFVPTLGLALSLLAALADAAEPTARVEKVYGYDQAIVLTRGNARAVLCPQVGGRVLEFSVDDRESMYVHDADKAWRPGGPVKLTAGRFDYGPELVTPPHPMLRTGKWTGEITGPCSARLTSIRDEKAGIQLVRDFELVEDAGGDANVPVQLICKQTIHNIASEVQEVCHWGRSFSPGGGICLVPLGDRPSRFPSKYCMYEDAAIINVDNTDELIRERDGFMEILAPPRKPMLGFDSMAGWFAYVMPNDTLFVKRFKTYPDRVYNEPAGMTVVVWYPTDGRIELEPIGPRERLQPGESASFAEHWWVFQFPYPEEGEQIDLDALTELVMSRTSAP